MGGRLTGQMFYSQALLWICSKKLEQLNSLCDPFYVPPPPPVEQRKYCPLKNKTEEQDLEVISNPHTQKKSLQKLQMFGSVVR